jgi:hypothetical protein
MVDGQGSFVNSLAVVGSRWDCSASLSARDLSTHTDGARVTSLLPRPTGPPQRSQNSVMKVPRCSRSA